jgi:hypothetical protein
MKWLSGLLLFCGMLPGLFAVESPYLPGKVIDIQQKMNTRVLYYLVNTPVTQDDPYYEVSVQLNSVTYVGQYTPRHAADTLPGDLAIDSAVQVRIDKRHMFLKSRGGRELDLIVIKRSVAKPEADKAQAAPARN